MRASGIYNIGSGQAKSLNDIIDVIQKSVQHINIIRAESRNIDVRVNVLNIEKIFKYTKWHPEVSIESGIKQLLSLKS